MDPKTLKHDVTFKISVDTAEADEKIEALIAKIDFVRAYLRPWWCPLWLYKLVNGEK